MLKGKYERIVDQFEHYYPYLYEQVIDWWPSGRLCITVKLKDGLLFEFDSFENTIRRIQSGDYTKDSETLRKDIGRNLQKLILSRGIPQSDIAAKCGVTEAMISRYIHGTSMPGLDKLYSIADALGCRITDILSDLYDE
jgi:DNA-binding Xre family transcriptional regulator